MSAVRRATPAVLLAPAALAWSPPAVDLWIGSSRLEDARLRAFLWAVAGLAAAWALLRLVRAPSRFSARIDLALVALLLLAPICGELALRAALAADLGDLRQPARFASPMGDDDYWLLLARWRGTNTIRPAAVDPELGWGIAPPSASLPAPPEELAVLCFGDSFVAGPVRRDLRIPEQLDALLPDVPVLNHGVGGYGVDQICLRLERYLPRYPRGVFVVGVMTRDIDRAILRYRGGQKPFAAVEDGRLVIRGQPVDPDPAAWLARNPPAIRSYLAALLVQWRRTRSGSSLDDYRREEKAAVARLLLERMTRAAQAHGRPLLYVLFEPREDLGRPGWRGELCRELLAEQGVPWIDAGALLRREASARGVAAARLFRRDNHPNAEANGLIARELAAKLAGLGWLERAPSAPR